jgi:hypothetical protein
VNDELARIWKEAVLILRYYQGIRLEVLRKTTANLCQDSRSPDRDLSPGPQEYGVGVLTMTFGAVSCLLNDFRYNGYFNGIRRAPGL